MPAGQSDRTAENRQIAVNEEDLDELYLLVQGAPYANTVLDAKTSLAQRDYETSLKLIESARDSYQQSNRSILRWVFGSPAEKSLKEQKHDRRLKQRQDRCKSVLAAFDDIVAVLRRMIRLRGGEKRPGKSGTSLTVEQLLQQGSPFRLEYETAHSTRLQMTAIRRFFSLEAVETQQDLMVGELYFLKGKEYSYLIQLRDASADLDELPVRLAFSDQPIKPIPRSKLEEMGQRKNLLRLVPKIEGRADESPETQTVLEESSAPDGISDSHRVEILDIGSFTQLHDAAIRAGLIGNADLIAHVRDREFPKGDYQRAFQVLEGLYGKFSAAMIQREQRLRREDIDIASGKVRMSPKKLMEKRARDTAESQRVDRARNRFLRVLEGLRVLMRTQ